MPAFSYLAVDPAGRRQAGRADAATAPALAQALESRGLTVLRVDEGAGQVGRRALVGGRERRAVLEATRALASLLSAGLPLARALAAAASVVAGATADVLHQVRAAVERGESLASALAAHPAHFPAVYVGMVRAGERGGDLAGAFARLTSQLEREEALRARLVAASVYPLVLAVVGGAATLLLLVVVLPRFAELLGGAGAKLPSSTSALLALSAGARRWWPLLLAVALSPLLVMAWARATDGGRRALGALLLAIPGIGTLRRQALAARTARLVGVLLSGGAALLAALDDAAQSVADPAARDDLVRVRAAVREGAPLSRALGESAIFPPLLGQLATVGEESGRLPEFLLKAAELFEERTERALQRLVALAEPLMIVVFGSLVGFVALSLLQAIYSVNASAFR